MAKLHLRRGPNAAPASISPVSFAFVQPLCFQTLTHPLSRRARRISFSSNHFRTLFIATEGVPLPLPILGSFSSLFAQRVFHNSFPINRFCTLSKNCRGVPQQFPFWLVPNITEAFIPSAPNTLEAPVPKSVSSLVTSLRPYFLFSNPFPCHTSENSPVSPTIATLPKTRVSNPCVCHTSETPPGVFPFCFSPLAPALLGSRVSQAHYRRAILGGSQDAEALPGRVRSSQRGIREVRRGKEIWPGKLLRLKQSGDFHAGHSGNAAGEIFHLVGEFFIDAPRRFIHRRANQVLHHLLFLPRENVRLKPNVPHLLSAIYLP